MKSTRAQRRFISPRLDADLKLEGYILKWTYQNLSGFLIG